MTDVLRQIQKGIDDYTAVTGLPPKKISVSGKAWDAILEAAATLIMIHADQSPDTLYGIPIEIVPDSPDGYVCIGTDLRRVNRECNV